MPDIWPLRRHPLWRATGRGYDEYGKAGLQVPFMVMPEQRPNAPHATPPARGSIFESFDSVAHLLKHSGLADGPRHAANPPVPGATDAPVQPDALVFRPLVRRPMALLQIVDDGRDDGEIVRVRGDRLVIGRSEGEIRIPHDISMSSSHAVIERLPEGGWQLADLGSATGTFVRVTTARLKHGSIILVGASRLRFDVIDMTEAWLVEVPLHGQGRRYECHGPVATIGRDAAVSQIVIDDPFMSPTHARVHRTQRGWRIENVGMNGLWVRLDAPVTLSAPAQFQCGEQRFVFIPLT